MAGPLVDTSVLIDFFDGTDSREAIILDRLLQHGPPPATAAIIVQEYLQGLDDQREFMLAAQDLASFDQLPVPDYNVHQRAAKSHVRMKKQGITVPTIDTLIVTLAEVAGRALLTADKRQQDFARYLKVKLV